MLRKLLIVDDDAANRTILRNMLQSEYDIFEAEGGEAALHLLHVMHIDIAAVLLALNMALTDEHSLLAKLRKDLAPIPVIVTLDCADAHAEVRALSLGASDCMIKPYHPAIVKHRLNNAIQLCQAASAAYSLRKDRLTGLYSREAFLEMAHEMILAQAPGFYVMTCFNIDNFKVINDQFGSDRGDAVLKHIAKVFHDGFDALGGICSRLGADNYAALYPSDCMHSKKLAEIRRKAAQIDGFAAPITFSIGRYIVDDLSLPVSAMFDRAAIAEASVKKRFDTHIALFDESMRERILHEQQIVNEMNAALAGEQFEIWLQPQFNHSSGALIGAEALVRWQHPQKGLVLPAAFLPVFERNGFIYELDKYVWEQACRCLRKWLDNGQNPLPVSVNVSRYDIIRADLVQVLIGLMTRYDLPAHLLRLEITESAFAKSTEQIIAVVRQLLDYGFLIEIDDFGSGYSSLNALKDVPASILKMDMRFLEGDENASRGGNILESVVRMAKWLGMPVIAEGVETRMQADFLQSIGCNYVQGYLYGRPMPVQAYEELLPHAEREERLPTLETVGSLDNNAFWNPASMETLIFNTYIGGACIFEYRNGSIELLRINSKYAEVITGSEKQMETALAVDLGAYMDAQSRDALRESIQGAVDANGESVCEAVFTDLPGRRGHIDLRFAFRVIARAEERCLLYTSVIDITKQRESERQTQESEKQLRFLNETARDLLAEDSGECGINRVLKKVRDFFGANRAYVFEMQQDDTVLSNTYEVCAPGVRSEMDQLQRIPKNATPFWWSVFTEQSYINIEDVSLLGADRAEEKSILEAQGIVSLIAVPLRRDGKLIGFIGVDDPHQQQSHVHHLQAIGDYIAVILTRRDLNEKIKRDNENLLHLMNDTPGGFSRMLVLADGSLITEYLNDRFCELRGMTREAILKTDATDALYPVHPDDRARVAATVQEMHRTGKTASAKYRLLHGNGSYTWFQVYGRITKSTSGSDYINAYFTAMSEAEIQAMLAETAQNADGGQTRIGEDTLRHAMSQMGKMVLLYDLYADAVTLPESFAQLYDLPLHVQEPLQYFAQSSILDAPSQKTFRAFIQTILSGTPSGSADLYAYRADGTWHWERADYVTLFDADQRPVRAIISVEDVTAQHSAEAQYEALKQSERLLRQVATLDGMTGLYNKITAEAMIRERLDRGGNVPCALLIVDLDRLKLINDSLGHDAGDRAISLLASALRTQFRQTDVVGRIGGDEFIAFMDGTSSETRLRSQISAFMRKIASLPILEGTDVTLHGSIGVATGACGVDSYESLFQRADRALYHVKRNGKNDYAFYTPEMEHSLYRYAGHTGTVLLTPDAFSSEDALHLLDAVTAIYPLVISANVTQNTYYMIQYANYTTKQCLDAGAFDELIADGAKTFHPEDRASFCAAFSRESLLDAHARGEAFVCHTGRQLGDDGMYRLIRTDAIFLHNKDSKDILQITLGREVQPCG